MTIKTENTFSQGLRAGKAKYKETIDARSKLNKVEESVENIYIGKLKHNVTVTTITRQDSNGNLRYFFKYPERIIAEKDKETFFSVSELGFVHDNFTRIDVTNPTLVSIE